MGRQIKAQRHQTCKIIRQIRGKVRTVGFRKQELGSKLTLQVPPSPTPGGPGSPIKRCPGFPGSPVLASVLMPQGEGGKVSTLQLVERRRHPTG